MSDMIIGIIFLILALVALIAATRSRKSQKEYDSRGFDSDHIHRNGTKFDDCGYDFYGYNKHGYNRQGRNADGGYDRLYDTERGIKDGFYSLREHPVGLTTHARERLAERLGITDYDRANIQAFSAYRFGKSKRQVKQSSAYLLEESEKREENKVALLYGGYIYIFSRENVLITLYRNEKIPL